MRETVGEACRGKERLRGKERGAVRVEERECERG
jgi:hypothetical protein